MDEVHRAIVLNDTKKLSTLLESHHGSISADGDLLELASTRDNLQCVHILLEFKADPNAPIKRSIYNRRTALHFASMRNNIDILLLLLRYNGDPTITDDFHQNALFMSVIFQQWKCAKILIPLSNVHAIDYKGSNVFDYVCTWMDDMSDTKVVEMLLDRGAKRQKQERCPIWIEEIRGGRHNAFKATSLVMTVLKKRCGVSKDMTTMIGKILWETRYFEDWKLKPEGFF